MRIISGIYGRRRFDVPSTFSARPTTDFAKENIFNVISNHIDFEGVDALDLFAGTGSISFELLSRECRSVTAVEKNNAHASFIAKVAKELKTDSLTLIRGDVFRYLHSAPAQGFLCLERIARSAGTCLQTRSAAGRRHLRDGTSEDK